MKRVVSGQIGRPRYWVNGLTVKIALDARNTPVTPQRGSLNDTMPPPITSVIDRRS